MNWQLPNHTHYIEYSIFCHIQATEKSYCLHKPQRVRQAEQRNRLGTKQPNTNLENNGIVFVAVKEFAYKAMHIPLCVKWPVNKLNCRPMGRMRCISDFSTEVRDCERELELRAQCRCFL